MLPDPNAPLKIGTRGSPLALAQAHETERRLTKAWNLPTGAVEIVVITTTGDRVQDRPLREIGGKGLFTREIEDALLDGGIDIAVHSMKDMPVLQPQGLVLDTYLPREDPSDALVGDGIRSLDDLDRGAIVGTSSLRRRAQLLVRRPDLEVVEFRGNVQTRLRKLRDGVARATFLAIAGLNRLEMTGVPATPIATDVLLPAVAQGAIGIERRQNDARIAELLRPIHDEPTQFRLNAERAFLAELDGSCQTPIAGLAHLDGDRLSLSGEILKPDGSEVYAGSREGSRSEGVGMGRDLGKELLSKAGSGFFD